MRFILVVLLLPLLPSLVFGESDSDVSVLVPIESVSAKEAATIGSTKSPTTDTKSPQTPKDSTIQQPIPIDSISVEALQSISIDVSPGQNEIITISQGRLNRLITPFDNPKVYTANDIKTQIEGRVIYVLSNADANNGLGLFITDGDNPDSAAISLTLVTRSIPPREIRFFMPTQQYRSVAAKNWEQQSSDYVSMLVATMGELANNRIPKGFALTIIDANIMYQKCRIPNLKLELRQTLDGYNLTIDVVAVTNIGNDPINMKSGICYQESVVASATWPNVLLAPGQQTELFLIQHKPLAGEQDIIRPSTVRN